MNDRPQDRLTVLAFQPQRYLQLWSIYNYHKIHISKGDVKKWHLKLVLVAVPELSGKTPYPKNSMKVLRVPV
ncbi:hypothetical protein DXT63_11865 [Thermoanaerobacteraceae bacterium SP2]|nr:hypothetical protein DXT63_11865 [Thermoanaerobacteraceae bacterium SP2]